MCATTEVNYDIVLNEELAISDLRAYSPTYIKWSELAKLQHWQGWETGVMQGDTWVDTVSFRGEEASLCLDNVASYTSPSTYQNPLTHTLQETHFPASWLYPIRDVWKENKESILVFDRSWTEPVSLYSQWETHSISKASVKYIGKLIKISRANNKKRKEVNGLLLLKLTLKVICLDKLFFF